MILRMQMPEIPPILFVDDDLIVVDKPEGIASIPGMGHENLLDILAGGGWGDLLPVHRLDLEVSGVLIYARNRDSHRYMNRLFDRREVCKTYVALVVGRMDRPMGRFSGKIREFGSGRMGIDEIRGKPTVTEWERISLFSEYTLVQLQPMSGRRHQLRVHLYAAGHPIAGDQRYGKEKSTALFSRLMLHAWRVEFPMQSGEMGKVTAPLSASFRKNLPRSDDQSHLPVGFF